MTTTDFENDIGNRVAHLEGEMSGMQQIAEALFKLSDRMHTDIVEMRTELKSDMRDMRTELKADMGDMRTELKADIRSGHWERLGIVLSVLVAGATIAASIYFKT